MLILFLLFIFSLSPAFSGPFPDSDGKPIVAGKVAAWNALSSISSSLSPPIRVKKFPKITGAFVQFSGGDNDREHGPFSEQQKAAFWERELESMKKAGLDTLIIQFNQYEGVHFSDVTRRILIAADAIGIDVFVGTALNEKSWFSNKHNPFFLSKEAKIISDYTRILVNQFKFHPSFVGVYIPQEDNTLAFPAPIGAFYAVIAKAVKEEKPSLKVMISPYTTLIPGVAKSFPKHVLEYYFKTVLSRAKVDICAWQDGVGGTEKQLERVSHDLGTLSNVCKMYKVQLWANIEVFHRTAAWNKPFSAEPTHIETLLRQLAAEAPYSKKVICFDFNHYFSPNNGVSKAKKLYDAYLTYLESQERLILRNSTFQK
ncbi:DUF4434 domain-containing protein [bacterium]|nr:DUF4434 domain-containing protein [bacterium]